MKRKEGITITVLVLAVTIMFIIITSATFIGTRNIDSVNYEEYTSQLSRVSNSINEYIVKNEDMPIKGESVSKSILTEDLTNELEKNGDKNNDLYVVDMSKLDVNNVGKGKGTLEDRDVFLVAENTNNVYYFKGYKYRGTMYYGV